MREGGGEGGRSSHIQTSSKATTIESWEYGHCGQETNKFTRLASGRHTHPKYETHIISTLTEDSKAEFEVSRVATLHALPSTSFQLRRRL